MRKLSRTTLSTLLSSTLLFLVAIVLSISIFFQNPSYDGQEVADDVFLFSRADFEAIENLKFKNPLQTFEFEHRKDTTSSAPSWFMLYPRRLYAREQTFNQIFETLVQIQVKKIFQKDPINLANFSLENPTTEITLIEQNKTSKTIAFGPINPIDQSTYLTISDQEYIYQIDNLPISFSTLSISDFVESRIFPFSPNEIMQLETFRGENLNVRPLLKLSLSDDLSHFVSFSQNLDTKKVIDFFNSLVGLRALFILDKRDEAQEKFLSTYLMRPLYTVQMTLTGNKLISYKIVSLPANIPGIKTDRKQLILVDASNRDYPFLFEREILDLFTKTERNFLP